MKKSKKISDFKTLQKIKISSDKAVSSLQRKFYVVDVETNGLQATSDKFIFGCMYGYKYMFYFRTIKDFLKEIQNERFQKSTIFAHNAEFDLTVIFGNIKTKLDREAIFNGKFILAKKDGITYADSMNIFPTSVKKIGESIGIQKQEIENEYLTGTVLKITDEMIDYCFRDCEIVYKALLKIFTMCQTIKPTLAGLSLIYYRKFYQPHAFVYNDKVCNEFFNSYYGGRVECFKLGKVKSYKYDINSMYPYVMSIGRFPNPRNVREIKNPHIELLKYHLEYSEGLAELEIEHKDYEFGFLPIKKDNKLLFPVGKFTGTWNFPEIRFALKMKAIKILSVKKVIYSSVMESPFKRFSEDLYLMRQKAKGIDNMILKLILNSLYGKFAQRIKSKEVYLPEMDYELLYELESKGKKYEVKMFSKDRKDCYIMIEVPPKNMYHTISLFSSYITSYARVYLLQQMIKYKDSSVTYVDTDCICVEKEIKSLKDSNTLGKFKKEDSFIIEIFGNKNYLEGSDLDILKNQMPLRKIKGIRKGSQQISENNFVVKKLIKTREAIRRNIQTGMSMEFVKENKNTYDKRIVLKDGRTKALRFK